MPELLLEIGCEEIPADDLLKLQDEIPKLSLKAFDTNRLECSSAQAFVTPRRLTLVAELAAEQKDLKEVRTGPPLKVALDAAGNPTPAALGFAKNLGISYDQVKTISTHKGEYLAAEILVKGRKVQELLPEILPALIKEFPFKKYMKWGAEEFVFGRPIRNLLVLFGGEVVPLKLGGVVSGRTTFGHRFMGSKSITVESFADYRESLEKNGVILRFEERADRILKKLHYHASTLNGKLREDEDLLNTMANEVEYPEVLKGDFPTDFLSLPQEILMNAMRKHQKYFCATGQDERLLPVFFTVLNTEPYNQDLIRKGHQRVLIARLRDAEFFWNEDRKTPLLARKQNLAKVTYHEKLGSYSEKIERMKSISEQITGQLNLPEVQPSLSNLIELSKVDLVTLMVGEFPELQGVMAGLYAREEGFPDEEWRALYDQYLPASAEGAMPRNMTGALLSLTDKIEILASGYVLNMIPTGSKDPYALRRAATGVMRIILDFKLAIEPAPVIDRALALYHRKTKLTSTEMRNGILDLLEARFRFLMEQRGIAHDYLNAVLAGRSANFVDAYNRANALWSKSKSEDLKTLARCFKRISNITSGQTEIEFDPENLVDDGEIRLNQVFSDMRFRVELLINEGQYLDALDIMVTLGPEIDNFFDEVLVMAEDNKLKNNRIALLHNINSLYKRIADFSQLQIERS